MTEPVNLNAERAKRKQKNPAKHLEGWEAALHVDGFGRVKRSLANVMTILSHHPLWQGVLAYDAFAESIVSQSEAPTRAQDKPALHAAGEWSEADSIRTAAWLAEVYGIDVGVQTVEQAVISVARRNVVHPVCDYLHKLKWDGVQRLPGMLAKYFGAEDSVYTQAIGTRFMISAVARVESPGCKVDTLPILESPQGYGKSTASRLLAVNPAWFADTGITLGDKDSYQNLRGKWLYELGELSSIRSARDVERIKAFLSAPVDSYRPSFGRRRVDFPRQTVFIGTTNEQEYLADRTGNRRFWPVKCGRIDLVGIERDREQLWAEAVTRYGCNEKWHIDTLDLAVECEAQQEERVQIDPWVPFVADWLRDPWIPDENLGHPARTWVTLANGITTTDVLVGAINMKRDRIDRAAETRAGQVLRYLRWERRQVRIGKVRQWRYFQPSLPVTTNEPEGGDTK